MPDQVQKVIVIKIEPQLPSDLIDTSAGSPTGTEQNIHVAWQAGRGKTNLPVHREHRPVASLTRSVRFRQLWPGPVGPDHRTRHYSASYCGGGAASNA